MDDGDEVFLVNLGRQAQDPRAFAVPDALLGQVIIAGSQFPTEVGYGGLGVPDLRGGNHPRRRVAKQAVRVAKNQLEISRLVPLHYRARN